MNRDANYTYVHMIDSMHADLFEEFSKTKLAADNIYVAPHLQPVNPEDEDDVVPDQHAAFGIQKATQKVRESVWRDNGLSELMRKGPITGKGSGTWKKTKIAGGGSRRMPR